MTSRPSVAVVTATTGRATLQQAIDSVAAQTCPCHHYIIVDGRENGFKGNWVAGPDSDIITFPSPTGKNGMMNGCISGAAAFITTEDYICFLDDDNWYEPDHVESLMSVIGDNAYAYSLRNIVEPDGAFFCRDDGEAIGHYGDLVDHNCFFFKREVCRGIAPLFTTTNGTVNVCDRQIWATFQQHNTPWAASGKYTVNYRMGGQCGAQKGFFFMKNIIKRSQYPDGFPWVAAA